MNKIKYLIICGLFLTACKAVQPETLPTNVKIQDSVVIWHDDKHLVTCWILGNSFDAGRALSCLPDSQIKNAGQ